MEKKIFIFQPAHFVGLCDYWVTMGQQWTLDDPARTPNITMQAN